jgi:hypothetical protein
MVRPQIWGTARRPACTSSAQPLVVSSSGRGGFFSLSGPSVVMRDNTMTGREGTPCSRKLQVAARSRNDSVQNSGTDLSVTAECLPVGETVGPSLRDRLQLAESLLRAVEDSVPPLQRLLAEVRREVERALHEEVASSRDQEIRALRREVDQLREGMTSRAAIERAKGILMQSHGISESESFDLLNEMSQRRRRKVRDLAADIANGLIASQPPGSLLGDVPAAAPAGRAPGRTTPDTDEPPISGSRGPPG